jgi:hypothetical protein
MYKIMLNSKENINIMDNSNDIFNSFLMPFFIAFGTIQIGLFLGLIFTNYAIKYYNATCEDDESSESDYEEEYEKKYPINKKLQANETPNEFNFIMENTPDGLVIMKYNLQNDGFDYWSDKNIKFIYLETVARKYVNDYHCSHLYIERPCNKVTYEDDGEEVDEEDADVCEDEDVGQDAVVEDDNVENDVADEKDECEDEYVGENEDMEDDADVEDGGTAIDDKMNSPFATFKNYNKNTTMNKDNKKNEFQITSCKFIKIGKIIDFNFIKTDEKITTQDINMKLDFQTFKNMLNK